MLKILLFDHEWELISSHLQIILQGQKAVVIAPGPQQADGLRGAFLRAHLAGQLQVKTVANFIREQSTEGTGAQTKAEILLQLAPLHKKLFPDKDFASFLFAYNLFSDLRGLGLSPHILKELSTLTQDYPLLELTAFSQMMEAAQIKDEHALYAQLERQFKEKGSNDPSAFYFFWGFNFFSQTQLSLLQAMGKNHDVFLPFPRQVWNEIKDEGALHWPNWLRSSVEVVELKSSAKLPSIQAQAFNRTMLPLIFSQILNEETSARDIFFNDSTLDCQHLFMAPTHQLSAKIQEDIFVEEMSAFLQKVEQTFFTQTKVARPLDQIYYWLKQEILSAYQVKGEKKFKRIKIVTMFLKVMEYWEGVSQAHQSMDDFDFHLMSSVMRLNNPRTFFHTLAETRIPFRLRSMESIHGLSSSQHPMLFLFKGNPLWKGSGSPLPRKLMNGLLTFGPSRNLKLDFLLNKAAMKDLLEVPGAQIFVEEGAIIEDVGLAELFGELKIEVLPALLSLAAPKMHDPLLVKLAEASHLTEISATRLQSYMDCPRRFYYKYVDKIIPEIFVEKELSPALLGVIQHESVRRFLTDEDSGGDEAFFLKAVQSVTELQLQKNQMTLTPSILDKVVLKIKDDTFEAAHWLWRFKESHPQAHFSFEHPLKLRDFKVHQTTLKVRGSADCVIEWEGKYLIFDFKRSHYSIPSQTEMRELKKIQLYFYLKFLDLPLEKLAIYGYLCLQDIDESLVYATAEAVVDLPEMRLLNGRPIEEMEKFSLKLEEVLGQMSQEVNFDPQPMNEALCRHCEFKNLCPKTKLA